MTRGLLVLGAVVALCACAEDLTTGSLSAGVTEVAVRPEDFLGDVGCSNNPGALRSYVVTWQAFDDASDSSPFTLPSSQPTPCASEARIRNLVVAGQRYTATIDGYEQTASELSPFGGRSSGSRQMVDADGNAVGPRWRASCGLSAASAVLAMEGQTSFVGGCTALVDSASSTTALRIDPARILGTDPCAVATALDVESITSSLANIVAMPCNAPPVDLPATADTSYRLYAHAVSVEQLEIGAECFAVSKAGQVVTPICEPPSHDGSVRIDLEGVEKDGKPACPQGSFYDVVSAGEAQNSLPIACHASTQIGPISPGIVKLDVVVYDSAGKPAAGGASCGAHVEPGRTVQAVCL